MKEQNIRLIDANEYKAILKGWLSGIHQSIGFDSIAETEGTTILQCIFLLDDMPTIDLESLRPVGKWKHRNKWDKFVCTACSFEADAPTPYCPNCGVRMEP